MSVVLVRSNSARNLRQSWISDIHCTYIVINVIMLYIQHQGEVLH